jgi:CheY-like chemotaxis protein
MPDQILVLVVEDEEPVRLVIVEALRDEGFDVMEVEHADAALVTLPEHAARIHVLFTDTQMPGKMDGVALAHHASTHWPQMLLDPGCVARRSGRETEFERRGIAKTHLRAMGSQCIISRPLKAQHCTTCIGQ